MHIDLKAKEVGNILREKYGKETTFRVFYVESDEEYEGRTGEKINDSMAAPDKNEYCLYF